MSRFLVLLALAAHAFGGVTIQYTARLTNINFLCGDPSCIQEFLTRYGLTAVTGPTGTEIPFSGTYSFDYPQTNLSPLAQYGQGRYTLSDFQINGKSIDFHNSPASQGGIKIDSNTAFDSYDVSVSFTGDGFYEPYEIVLDLFEYLSPGAVDANILPPNVSFFGQQITLAGAGSPELIYVGPNGGADEFNAQIVWTSASLAALTIDGKLLGQDCPQCGDPISLASGNVFESITDYTTAGPNKLAFTRYYNSLASAAPASFATSMGVNWRSNYDRYIRVVSPSTVTVERPDGQMLNFNLNGTTWTSDTDIDLKLTQTGSTWTLSDGKDTIETFTATGTSQAILSSIQARNGYTQTLSYDAANHLTSVTDSFGRSLQFTYLNGLLATLVTPDNLTVTYGYDSSGVQPGTLDRMTTVNYSTDPPTGVTYLYENPALPFAMTALIDENGARYISWTYDSNGRATSSQRAGGAGIVQVAYNDTDGSRTVTSPLGQQTLVKFAKLQGIPKLSELDRLDASGAVTATRTFTYDSNGFLSGHTDWNGNQTQYINDSHGQQTSIIEGAATPVARTKLVTYDSTFHLPVKIVEPGITTTFTYDTSGNLLTRTAADTTTTKVPYSTNGTQRTWTYTWANGLLASVKGPRGDVPQLTSFVYDGSGTLISSTNALSRKIQITAHLPGGLPQTSIDANGVTTQIAYDARFRPLTRTIMTAGGPLATTYSYDAAGNLLTTTLPDGSAITNSYDAAHRLTGATDLFNQSSAFVLDALGSRTQVSMLDASGAVQRSHSSAFDPLGRPLQDTGGAGQTIQFAFDGNGNATAFTDALSRSTAQAFDALNRRTAVADSAGGVTATTFDAHDRPLTVTAANGAVTSYIYDGFGDVIETISPDSGQTIYRYDASGNLAQKTDASGAIANYSYDALDRLTAIVFPAAAAENIGLRYDESGHGFGIGKLTSATDPAGSLSRSYDERGNLLTESRSTGASATLVTAYTYDAADRVTSIAYPSGTIVNYTRDAMGRVTEIDATPSNGAAPLPVVTSIGYLPFGPVNSLTFGNGIAESSTFDADYRLTNITDTGSAVAIQNLTYGYDAANNVLSITDAVESANSQTFGYDALDRLTAASGSYNSLGYSYDAAGNRLTQQMADGTTTAYSYVAQSNQLQQMVSGGGTTQNLSYTATGNISALGDASATSLAYNQAGRLAKATSNGQPAIQYTYDVFGRRLIKAGAATATTLFQYDWRGHLLEEMDGQGRAQVDYIYLANRPVATIEPATGNINFLHTDRLGTPQLATGSDQAIVWQANYDPFGTTAFNPASIAQDLRLPGQEFELEAPWYHNGFRDYSPSLGRYLESDPAGLLGGINTYAYSLNNPLARIDRNGLDNSTALQPTDPNYETSLKYPLPGFNAFFAHGKKGDMDEALTCLPIPGSDKPTCVPVSIDSIVDALYAADSGGYTPVFLGVCYSGDGGSDSLLGKVLIAFAARVGHPVSGLAPAGILTVDPGSADPVNPGGSWLWGYVNPPDH